MCDAYRYTLIPAYLYIFRTSVNQCLLLYWVFNLCFWDWCITDANFSKQAWNPGTLEPLLLFG